MIFEDTYINKAMPCKKNVPMLTLNPYMTIITVTYTKLAAYFLWFVSQVKVDESCSLEHVTRNRPKGNRGRRPPTRIHMKEVRYNCFKHTKKPFNIYHPCWRIIRDA